MQGYVRSHKMLHRQQNDGEHIEESTRGYNNYKGLSECDSGRGQYLLENLQKSCCSVSMQFVTMAEFGGKSYIWDFQKLTIAISVLFTNKNNYCFHISL